MLSNKAVGKKEEGEFFSITAFVFPSHHEWRYTMKPFFPGDG